MLDEVRFLEAAQRLANRSTRLVRKPDQIDGASVRMIPHQREQMLVEVGGPKAAALACRCRAFAELKARGWRQRLRGSASRDR
jgi:hypothetical protein